MEALPFYYGQVNHHELEKDMFNIVYDGDKLADMCHRHLITVTKQKNKHIAEHMKRIISIGKNSTDWI